MKKAYPLKRFIQATLFGVAGILVSYCTQNKEQLGRTKATDPIVPPHVTILANLPDSSKPKVTLLAERPKPLIRLNFKPSKIHSFIDSLTGLPLAAEVQGSGFFTSYTTDDGLVSDMVGCSAMDKDGAIWFGTNGGVSKYDGKRFTTYTTAQGLAGNQVRSILEDKKGNLWFGAGWRGSGGVSKYDGKKFTVYTTAQGLAHNKLWSIIEDSKGNMWFGTNGGGVSKYDGKKFTTYTTAQGLADNYVTSILEDKKGNMWFSTGSGDGTGKGGLSKYDGNTFTTYTTIQGLASNQIISSLEDSAGNLWFGTLGGGMSKYDGQRFTTYTTAQGLANNGVLSIIEDRLGNIWFSTRGGGISKYSGKSVTRFSTTQGLGNNLATTVLEDKKGNLWFSTVYGGVSKYDGKSLETYTNNQGIEYSFLSSMEDKAGNLWFGGMNVGVSKYDGKVFITYSKSQGLAGNTVAPIEEDKLGNMWFGTSEGVSKYDGKGFATYTTAQGLANNMVNSILEDRLGNIWFGTEGGVSKYDGKQFTTYTTAQGLANNVVWSIIEDTKGNIWFGTVGGLSVIPWNKLMEEMGKSIDKESLQEPLFITFTTIDGLPNNTIAEVCEDNEGRLIVGTSLGIAILKKGIRSFSVEGGVELYSSANGYPLQTGLSVFVDSKGIIWIGTDSDKTGLVRFDYKAVHKTKEAPVLLLQQVKINNETIGWNTLLPSSKSEKAGIKLDSLTNQASITEEVTAFGRGLSDGERENMRRKFSDVQFDGITPWYPIPQDLVLPYHHNSISFGFNAIETSRNFLVKYQYKLEGYDEEWSLLSDNTAAIFGNMYEGNYTFRVKALSPEGVWSKPITYTFTVLPPLWRTPWAYGLYGLVLLSMAAIGRQAIVKRERLKADQRFRQLQADQLHQIDQLKSRFFTNVSHEFRTPLTLILGPLDKLLAGQLETSQLPHHYRLMQRNAQRLLQLINQLLDFAKLEACSLQLHPTSGDLLQRVKVLTFSFASLAESQAIQLSFHSEYSRLLAHFDADLLDKMLGNLLSNALKFTPSGGSVSVELSLDPPPKSAAPAPAVLVLQVCDTGPGIAADQQEKIFERFYQGDTTHAARGTGIGLALVKELAELHQGSISVQSELGSGTRFTLQLPLSDCQVELKPAAPPTSLSPLPINGQAAAKLTQTLAGRDQHPLLLVVEDNVEVRQFLSDSLQNEFQVLEAANGQEALQLGRQHIPDLVITDWMMPIMDGIELCHQLKTDELTSHIPVIVLTAKASQASKLEGLETGADDYLAKPFSLAELTARVNNLIAQRRQLRQRFSREVKLQPKDIAITSVDEAFLKRTIALIEAHMSDTDFSVERLVVEIGMSRPQLHRKLKALTDESTSEFIRTIRLKRAASLLEQGFGNVSEVMYEVGFNSVSYFASNFKLRYGVNPSQYPPAQQEPS